MVEFALGLCLGIIICLIVLIFWSNKISSEQQKLNIELIKEFREGLLVDEDNVFNTKRYES